MPGGVRGGVRALPFGVWRRTRVMNRAKSSVADATGPRLPSLPLFSKPPSALPRERGDLQGVSATWFDLGDDGSVNRGRTWRPATCPRGRRRWMDEDDRRRSARTGTAGFGGSPVAAEACRSLCVRGLLVNAVSPAFVYTSMTYAMTKKALQEERHQSGEGDRLVLDEERPFMEHRSPW